MAINLSKGSSINLQKEKPGIDRITVGLGWDVNEGVSSYDFDLDASVLVLNANNKLVSDDYFVFYNNLRTPDGAIVHNGDNRTGAGEGDDETINVQFSRLPQDAVQILITITIDKAAERGQNFGMVPNSFARVYNTDTGELICQTILSSEHAAGDVLIVGAFARTGNSWEFRSMGQEYNGGLQYLIDFYA